MSTKPPSRTAEQFVLRLPEGMRDRIAAVAKANGRSMNAEIVHCIEASLGHRMLPLPDQEQMQAIFNQMLARAIDSGIVPTKVGPSDKTVRRKSKDQE